MTHTEPIDPAAPAEPMAAEAAPTPEVTAAADAAATAEAAAPTEAAPSPTELSPAACAAKLAELFPALFVAPGAPGPVKPIKLRIHTDIHARAPGIFSRRVLGIFFSRYTTTNAYLKALVAPGAQRFDLDGQPAGEIAEEHRAAAVEEIERRRSIAIERRAAERKVFAAASAAPAHATPASDAPPQPRHVDRRPARGPRPTEVRSERPERGPRPPQRPPQRAPRNDRPPRPARSEARPLPAPPRETPAPLPADPAQRERLLLLRSFESSPLSKANFCALKRISEAELDAALAQARQERAAVKG